MMRGIKAFVLLGICLLLFSSWHNSTSQQTKKASKDLQHEVTVTLKLIQIFVTDKDGNPITDLDLSDFELYDNGKLQILTEFEKHDLTLPIKEPLGDEIQEVDIPPEKLKRISRKFLLFFDFAFMRPGAIPLAKKLALYFIDRQLHPEDEIGIMSYNVFRGLQLHEYFTTNHQVVRKAILEFGIRDTIGRAQNLIEDYWDPSSLGAVDMQANKQIYNSQIKNISQDIMDLSKALRYIPGSKHLVFFSDGVYNHVYLYDVWDTPATRYAIGGRYSPAREFYQTMSNALAVSNCPVYPVNTAGRLGDLSLRELAKRSGGTYFDNVVYYEDITEKIQNMTSCYYILGYYVDDKWDGKYHKIKVKVKRKGYKIYGQQGYYNPKPFTDYTDLEKSLHLVDLALNENPLLQEPLSFPLTTLPIPRNEPNALAITKIPWEAIKEISGGKMEVVTLFFDNDDNIAALEKTQASALRLANDGYFYSFSSLAPGLYECRVVIRNLNTGQGATASSSVTIPEASGAEFELFPPLLFLPTENAQYFKSLEEKDGVTIADVYPFDVTKYAPVVDQIEKDTSSIFACIPYYSAVESLDIELNAILIQNATGLEIPLSIERITKNDEKGNTKCLTLKMNLPVLSVGDYSIKLFAVEKTAQFKSQTETVFSIKEKS